MKDTLDGGRDDIYREDNCVIRPTNFWTVHIHRYLKYLHDKGFSKVPYPYEIDVSGKEKVSYVEGSVYNGILPDEVRSDEALISFCKLIRQYHDIGEEYIEKLTGNEQWMLAVQTPTETMCHGDLAPYNIAMNGKEAVGIIDFDTLHPGPRLWDIAYALYRWIPLMSPDNPESFGDEEDKNRRLRLFISTYGLNDISYKEILGSVIARLQYLISFMENEARKGNSTFIQDIEEGHLEQYKKDLMYIESYWYNNVC
jgi:thiamine kinase-like enzyme